MALRRRRHLSLSRCLRDLQAPLLRLSLDLNGQPTISSTRAARTLPSSTCLLEAVLPLPGMPPSLLLGAGVFSLSSLLAITTPMPQTTRQPDLPRLLLLATAAATMLGTLANLAQTLAP